MIQVLPIDNQFVEANKEFLEAVQEAIKVGASINIPTGLDNQPEIVTRFNLIEQEITSRFDQVHTLIKISGFILQFLFGSMECLVTCILTQSNNDRNFNIQVTRLSHKSTFTPR